MFTCPCCYEHIECKLVSIAEHLKGHEYSEFQCIYCSSGFEHVSAAREHMSQQHASYYLFVVARMSATPQNEMEDGQIVYIGKSQNYTQYSLSKCSNLSLLSYMDPTEINPQNQIGAQKAKMQGIGQIKTPFTKNIPHITYVGTSDDFFIEYNEYEKKFIEQLSIDEKNDTTIESKNQSSVHNVQQKTKSIVTQFEPISDIQNPEPSQMQRESYKAATNEINRLSPLELKPLQLNTKSDLSELGETVATVTITDSTRAVSINPSSVKLHPALSNPTPKQQKKKPTAICSDPSARSSESPNSVTNSSWSIKYRCISARVAEELVKRQNMSYKSQICRDCDKFIKDEDETTYLNHLMTTTHSCNTSENSLVGILTHRMKEHSKHPIVCLVAESLNGLVVYKLIQTKFQCELCNKEFEIRSKMIYHNSNDHENTYATVRLVQYIRVIQSNDPNQVVNFQKTENNHIIYCDWFYCNNTSCRNTKWFGTRSEAIEHYNKMHWTTKEKFEFSIRTIMYIDKPGNPLKLKKSSEENQNEHRMYVFECQHCLKLYGSMSSAEAHMEEIRNTTSNSRLFTINKWLSCHKDKSINTYAQLKSHYSINHPNEPFTPTDMLRTMCCGLCLYDYNTSEELKNHYQRKHLDLHSVCLSDQLVKSLCLDQIDKCMFIPSCCPAETFHLPLQIVQHVAACKDRFGCTECQSIQFGNVVEFIAHRRHMHQEEEENLINELHNLKKFNLLLSNMTILFPNRLVLTKAAIEETTYGNKLQRILTKCIDEVFESEKKFFATPNRQSSFPVLF